MGRTIISEDRRFEWDEAKERLNIKSHGFSFQEILKVFDDPT
ncbi:MAG: BrnT family toxin, partial [Treponema sp.]|nr:BrnT family toxin [Treponema sp.]